jgi:uncharacterized protein (TIGR02757 family)
LSPRDFLPGPPSFSGAAPSFAADLDALVARYERPAFIASDPIALPHGFDERGDREVIGLYSALLAWGKRSIMLAKLAELVERMRGRPLAFVLGFDPDRDGDRLAGFRHRTFQPDDAVALTLSLRDTLRRYGTVEAAFAEHLPAGAQDIGPAIEGLSTTLLSLVPDTPPRMAKHLARPSTGSACKRLAMYARWMVRPGPVDLGLWSCARADQLVLPLDVHTGRQARRLGLLARPQDDWRAVLELTAACRALNRRDPARYDFALFGLGAYGGKALVEDC